MKYKLYADTHLYSPIEILRNEVLSEVQKEHVLFLGDIFDLANVAKDEIKKAQTTYAAFKSIHKGNYIDGNHERVSKLNQIIVKNGIVFAHGDMEANPDKWTEYRKKPHGASTFKRKVIIPFIAEAEQIKNRKPKQDFLERASVLTKSNNCHTYICGHFHTKEQIDITYKGIRIIILKRGKTELEL